MDLRILILIIDLGSARGFDFQGFHQVLNLKGEAPGLESEITRRLLSGIEMLMKPFRRRHEERARLPVDARARFTGFPQQRITLAGKNHDMRARPMPMGSRISSNRVFFDMRADRVRREMQKDAARP